MIKLKLKPSILIISLILFQSLIYFITKLLQGSAHVLETAFDNTLPYISWFIYFYIIWYPMLFIVPYIIYEKNKKVFSQFFLTYIISIIICGVIFILFPTTINRPIITDTNLSNKFVKLIYLLDTPMINCLPSIHCLIAFLFIFGIKKIELKKVYKWTIYILSICIVLSTLFVKQHVIYDVVASFIISILVWKIVEKFYNKLILLIPPLS